VLTAIISVSEMIAIFLQLILFANTAAFFYSLLGLVSTVFEKATAVRKFPRDGVASKRFYAQLIRSTTSRFFEGGSTVPHEKIYI